VAAKIRSGHGPLIKDCEKGLKNGGLNGVRKFFEDFGNLGESSEKGYTRKSTKNRVARCRKLFGGIFGDLRCFTKRIYLGEFGLGGFWVFVRGST
jgi:hypothetical protein